MVTRKRPRSAQPHRYARLAGASKVGIVWLVGRRLIFDSTPVAEAEDYGDCKTHGRSHSDCWTELQKRGTVPRRRVRPVSSWARGLQQENPSVQLDARR